jgi:hypothetical protein
MTYATFSELYAAIKPEVAIIIKGFRDTHSVWNARDFIRSCGVPDPTDYSPSSLLMTIYNHYLTHFGAQDAWDLTRKQLGKIISRVLKEDFKDLYVDFTLNSGVHVWDRKSHYAWKI